MAPGKRDIDRAKRTLYVTGFDSKCMTKRLLEELFSQGGPVSEIILFETHAFVQFQHEESVPYCLALFNEIELHGQKLRISPRHKSKSAFCYLKYLMAVREKLMTENRKIPAPDLPPRQTLVKQSSKKTTNSMKKQRHSKNTKRAKTKQMRRFKANNRSGRDNPI